MKWGNWPYWVRGGIIAVALSLLAIIALYFSGLIRVVSYTVQCLVAPCWNELHFYIFNTNIIRTQEFVFLMIGAIAAFAVMGSLGGLIYGKFRGDMLRTYPRSRGTHPENAGLWAKNESERKA
ncbi:MAG: hypothetical protein A3G59_03655 [Candidatus Taylorbacteria bacterium RIFCSPLOWO2_12_FULL_47_20]|uniref:Uncharacterized protein n=2 Tax=Candidatus Tayloriibacteriota TaxID=1817919 RepID=A0A1G2P5E7_9BACT|nr:MAG: hypothetical protein A3H68_00080 [Candidatus Taylorbacteria bacterium RIFCSPLOWO2_02_FULL_46_40]OHA43483.1 MAG: hypothetical protein A3G59_03655 [Candidatus Taylorbacteria bacterium RIFCSPLOWO2_12_FULL_47_20]